MITSTKRRSTRYMPDDDHISYGIQNWLCGKGYCLKGGAKYKVDPEIYEALLKEFCLYDKPDFDLSKVKNRRSYERYIDKRFSKFCVFVVRKFKTIPGQAIDKTKMEK